MSVRGHQRRFEYVPRTSALPPIQTYCCLAANDVLGQFRTCRPKQAQATVYLLVDDFDRADGRKRQNPEDINRLPFLITRRQDNGLAPFNSAAALLSSPHTRPGRCGFLLPKRERGEKRNSIFPVHPLAHAIHSYAKLRGTLDATIRTRPEDTR